MQRQLVAETPSFKLTAREAAAVLFRRWRLAAGLSLPLLLATLAYAWLAPNQYAARAKILVKNTRADVPITPEKTNGPMPASAEALTETQINSELQLLTSKDLLLQVVRDCGLAQADDGWLAFGAARSPAEREERAVRRLEKTLAVAPVKKSNLIEISYTARTPEASHAVLQRLSELYFAKHVQVHRPAGAQDFFAAQTAKYEEQLRDAEAAFHRHQRQLNTVALNEEKGLHLRRLLETRARLQAAEAALSEATNQIATLQRALPQQQPRIVTLSRALPYQQSVESLNTLSVELQNKRTQLLTRFQPADRLVREVEQQLQDTQAALAQARQQTGREESTDLNPLRQQLAAALEKAKTEQAGVQARRDTLAAQFAQQQTQLARLDAGTQEHDALARQVKTLDENYRLYARKRDEAVIAAALDQRQITNVALAEAPTFAQLPTAPNRWLALALGLFLTGFLALGGVVTAELWRDTVLTPHELEALTGQPVLATAPLAARVVAPVASAPPMLAERSEALAEI